MRVRSIVAPLLALAVVGGLFSFGCPADGPPPPSDEGPRDTLVIGATADAKDLLPPVYQQAADAHVIEAIFMDPLDGDFDCAVQYRPELAKSWTWDESGKVLSVELRDDLTWYDGTKVTAKDLAFAYELVADDAVASPRKPYVARMDPNARPKVIDDFHVEWHFTEVYDRPTMLAHTSHPPVPKHLLEKADRASLRTHALNTGIPVANGPWKVTAREKNVKLVLEPNEKYTGPPERKPKLRRVVFKTLPEYATRIVELENGSVDLVENLLVADADSLAQEHPEIRLHRRGWRSMDYVAWNNIDPNDYKAQSATTPQPKITGLKPHPLFGDREVRRALAGAVDVDKLIRDLLTSKVTGEVYGRPAIGSITPALCGMHNDTIQRIPFDPAAARARLAELGWTDTNGDGVLDKDGVPFRFTMITNSGNERRAQASVIVQANLKEVGVDVQIEKLESGTFFDRLRKKDFDAALSGWSAALFIDPSSTWGEDSVFNFTSYHNPAVSALIERGLREPDPEKAKPIWHELQQVVYDDQPYDFLYWLDEIVAVHSRFENVKIDVLAPYRDLWAWSVPPDKVKYKQ
ncbi:MAG: ABC transporter substrate-binding protein [Myxococcota bacterium]